MTRTANTADNLQTDAAVITYGEIGPRWTRSVTIRHPDRWFDRRQGETLQPVMLNGEHVGDLARHYTADEGEPLRLAFYQWRPYSPDHYLALDDADDCVFDYSAPRAVLAAKKAQIAAALGA